MNQALSNVLSRLKGVKRCGNGYKAYCPAHDDQKQSLHVSEGKDGRVLIHCHAGCSVNNICQALGIEVKDLFPQKPEVYAGGKSPVVATYDYRDANGKLLFQVCRTADKRFFQRRPDGKGGWINGLGDIKPVIYRLSEVLQAVKQGETIFIPEGEKDVDNLARLGLAATCNPMGAGKWRDHYSEHLRGAKVVILPDNDEPGRKHAQQAAKSLYGKAASVKVLELPGLPEKGDVSDWLAAGGTREELLELAAEAPEWEPKDGKSKPVVVRLADVEAEEVCWLWEPYIPRGKLTILEGDPGIGKTFLALQVTAIVSCGDPFPGADGAPRDTREPENVIYLTAEDGLGDTLRPRLDRAGADVSRVYALTAKVDEEGKHEAVTLRDIEVLDAAIKRLKPALVVIDPLQAYLGASVDMHRANEVRPVLSGLAHLAEKYKCAVLCIRHLGKSQQDRAIYRGLGSIDFAAAARSILLVGQHPDDERKRVVAQSKNSLATKGESIAFELGEDGFFWCGVSDVTAEALLAAPKSEEEKTALEEAVDFLKDVLAEGPRPVGEILREARKMGIAERTLKRAKAQAAVHAKRIGEQGKRGGGTWYWDLPCQDGRLNQISIRDHFGTLNQGAENPVNTGIPGRELRMPHGTLNEVPETPINRASTGFDLECQNEPLKKSGSNGESDNLNPCVDENHVPCKYCGEPITFAKDVETGKWLPMRPDYTGFHKCKEARK